MPNKPAPEMDTRGPLAYAGCALLAVLCVTALAWWGFA